MKNLKGIILAAGYGTRFLPITKTIPKEMLPLVNVPAIHFIIEEFMQAGIKDIIIISHRNKKSLEDYFDRLPELENFFSVSGKTEHLQKIHPYELNIAFIRQRHMGGPGDALMLAEPFIGDSPFIVAFPDDIIISSIGLTEQLISVYEKYDQSVISLMQIEGDVSRYGVVDPGLRKDEKTLILKGMIEKPSCGKEPSKIISIGRYLFKSEYLKKLTELKKNHLTGEFYLTGGIQCLSQEEKMLGYLFDGKRLDVGEPNGYIEALLDYINTKEEYKEIFNNYVKKHNC